MKIQPTAMKVSPSLTFGNRQVRTKLPKDLMAKPKKKPPKGLLYSLAMISLLTICTILWRSTWTYKAQKLYAQYQHDYNEIKNDTIYDNEQDSINNARKLDSLTFNFFSKLAELVPVSDTNKSDVKMAKTEQLYKEYQQNYNKIKNDTIYDNEQDSINHKRMLDSLTMDFLGKMAESITEANTDENENSSQTNTQDDKKSKIKKHIKRVLK